MEERMMNVVYSKNAFKTKFRCIPMVQVDEGRWLCTSDDVNIGSSDVLCPWSSIAFNVLSSKLECWLLFCESSISQVLPWFVLNEDSFDCSSVVLQLKFFWIEMQWYAPHNGTYIVGRCFTNLHNLNQLLMLDKCSEWRNLSI